MAGIKRKHKSAPASHAHKDVDPAEGTILVAENPFTVKVFDEVKRSPKKARSGQGTDRFKELGWDAADKTIHYEIKPRSKWNKLKDYQNFVGKTLRFPAIYTFAAYTFQKCLRRPSAKATSC